MSGTAERLGPRAESGARNEKTRRKGARAPESDRLWLLGFPPDQIHGLPLPGPSPTGLTNIGTLTERIIP